MQGNNGKCARYCCDDGDCGSGGVCDTSLLVEHVGICVTMIDAAGEAQACSAPMTAPSNGSCFTGLGDGGAGDAGGG